VCFGCPDHHSGSSQLPVAQLRAALAGPETRTCSGCGSGKVSAISYSRLVGQRMLAAAGQVPAVPGKDTALRNLLSGDPRTAPSHELVSWFHFRISAL
jgi:hypothetical protein